MTRYKINPLDPTGLSPIEDKVISTSGGGGGGPSTSISVTGEPKLTGDVTLSAGSNVTLTQTGQNIQIASSGGGGGGGGSSISYYLNGSVNQGTFSGNTYYEMNKSAVVGSGTNFTINANGYIAQFITDAGDPNLLKIPGGNWNFEMYFSASSSGGSPSFYLELYKYNGTTLSLIASGSTSPEVISGGTAKDAYFTALAVPETSLSLTDRLAIRVYVTPGGRTITLYTEDNNLCEVITTFTSGLTAINGLTTQVQYITAGTSGTDFNVSSATDTHTLNLPTASATNRGALSSADWTTFNNKQPALGFTPEDVANKDITGTLGTSDTKYPSQKAVKTYVDTGLATKEPTLTKGNLTESTSSVLTISGGSNAVIGSGTSIEVKQSSGTQSGFLSSTDWTTFNNKEPAVTKGNLTESTSSVLTISGGSNAVIGSGTSIQVKQASGSQSGFLSSTDWTTFNNKQAALGFTPEDVANKSTNTALGTSDTLYPSQKAVKTYVDGLTTATQTRNEVPSGTINGSNTSFTLAATPATGSLRLYKNGVRLKPGAGNDYTISGSTITMATAPATGTLLLADYEVSAGTFAQGVSNFITNEVPSGSVNGSNTSFTTAQSYIGGTLEVYINGVKQLRTTHYSETTPASGTFAMSDAPLTGDVIEVRYQHLLSSTGDAATLMGYQATTSAVATKIPVLDANAKLPAQTVGNSSLNTTAGDIGGAWQDWTPSFTNFTKGSATITAKYQLIGKTVHFRLKIKLSGSTMGTGPKFSLPVAAATGMGDDEGYILTRNVRLLDAGIAEYEGHIRLNGSTTDATIYAENASSTYLQRADITSTLPFAWGDADCIFIIGMYEAA